MLYAGQRHTLPHSEYGIVLDVMRETGWTWDDYLSQPADLIDELETRMIAQADAETKRAKQAERAARKKR